MNRLIETYFSKRGYTPEFLAEIEDSGYKDFAHIWELCAELHEIHQSGKRLVILPDFDMDGIMSGTLGFAGFSELGFCVSLFRPTPSDGYGFTADTIDRLIAEYPDVYAIITCDVGITCMEGTKRAKELGIRVFVTDHHKQEGYEHPADIVINPNGADQGFGADVRTRGFCGAAVFWNVLSHYARVYGDTAVQEQIARLRVFAGIATVSDMMPLRYANRELVRDACGICRYIYSDGTKASLSELNGSRAYLSAFYGLFVTLDVFARNDKFSSIDDINEEFFGYYLAPMFNSVKRMGGDMSLAFGVFFGPSPSSDAEALFEMNEQRKAEVTRYYGRLFEEKQPYAPHIYVSDAPSGILGLLATKLLTSNGLPVMVVRKDGNSYHGSGRSPEWYPALTMLRGDGFWAAGHEGAFGVGFTDTREVGSAAAFLTKSVSDVIATLPSGESVSEADIVIATDGTGDIGIDIPEFLDFMSELKHFEPFGRGFEAPAIEFRFSPSEAEWVTMGSNNQHVKGVFAHGFEFLFWNGADMLEEWQSADELSFIGSLGLNVFMGRRTVNFVARSGGVLR